MMKLQVRKSEGQKTSFYLTHMLASQYGSTQRGGSSSHSVDMLSEVKNAS